ncbi:MAG: dienelactone hydrolase family protein [Gammaproteobacteria bacterium]|nr:dienelactone hydrolase family protein [Gammaproteobacteria bacterium]
MPMIHVAMSVLLLLYSSVLSGNGLNNQTKQFTPNSKMSSADWSSPDELHRTWQAALVRIPKHHQVYAGQISDLPIEALPVKEKLPIVIYLHGCSGVWWGTYIRLDFFAENGFAVIAPASFARAKYPKSCDPATKRAGLYRETLKMRQYDALNAIKNAKQLDWVDSKNLFLVGFSQGGITSATLSTNIDTTVNARVIEGWTCHAGWSEYRGINAPVSEPVLALVADQDPWFQDSWTRGSCGRYMNSENGSRSMVYRTGSLMSKHSLLDDSDVQNRVLEFLHTHMIE